LDPQKNQTETKSQQTLKIFLPLKKIFANKQKTKQKAMGKSRKICHLNQIENTLVTQKFLSS
jgi:hypothetical protein